MCFSTFTIQSHLSSLNAAFEQPMSFAQVLNPPGGRPGALQSLKLRVCTVLYYCSLCTLVTVQRRVCARVCFSRGKIILCCYKNLYSTVHNPQSCVLHACSCPHMCACTRGNSSVKREHAALFIELITNKV